METLRSYDELAAWAAAHGAPVHIAVGFYDGVHRGHRHLLGTLRDAAGRAGARALALTFANSPRAFHGAAVSDWRYLTLPDEKLLLLGETDIDAALMLTYDAATAGQTARQFLAGLARRVPLSGLCVGYDTSIGCDLVRGYQQFSTLTRELGLELTYVEPLELDGAAVKSSRIRELVSAGDLPAAARLLGHRYFISGTVVHGKGKGAAELGIPTANVDVPPVKLVPPPGIYAGVVHLPEPYPAALCLSTVEQHFATVLEGARPQAGPQPADDLGPPAILEAAIAGFHGKLYGKPLRAEFGGLLRGWIDFARPADLAEQMRADIEAAERAATEELEKPC